MNKISQELRAALQDLQNKFDPEVSITPSGKLLSFSVKGVSKDVFVGIPQNKSSLMQLKSGVIPAPEMILSGGNIIALDYDPNIKFLLMIAKIGTEVESIKKVLSIIIPNI